MVRFLKQYVGPLLAAILITILLACFFQTQRVISLLGDIGGAVSMSDRISMTLYDIRYLGAIYGIFISIAMFIALTVALFLARKMPKQKMPIYICAGALAILVLLFSVKQVFFGVHIIAGARDGFGLAFQALAGAIGGWMFYRLRQNPA